MVIGLTGPTGAGKSTASRTAEAFGFKIIDADLAAREAVKKGSPLLEKICFEFGNVLNKDGSLDRKKLAASAFKNQECTKKLNSVMLPYIKNLIARKIAVLESDGAKLILLDAPTLFEAKADSLCFKIIGVLAPKELRLKRIMNRDGITKDAAELRMNAGKSDDFYLEHCDCILINEGSEQDFQQECDKLFKSFLLETEAAT